MNLLAFLPWCKVSAQPVLAAEPVLEPQPEADDAEEALSGCGWFDSSHELHAGLSVREHVGTDTLVNELPLASWLELHLGNWCPAPLAA